MKKIILATFISSIIFATPLFSATMLQPSLGAQMIKQEQINKKNVIQTRLAEKARIKQEAKNALLARQQQFLQHKNKLQETKSLLPKFGISPVPPKLTPVIAIQQPSHTIIMSSNIPSPNSVDMNRVRSTWIGWYNGVRQSEGLTSYTYDTRLDSTAYDWNIEFAKGRGQNHHRRNPSDSYYDFQVIDQWFGIRGVNPTVINRAKNTENVGYGYYNCNSSDCTDSLIRSIRSTFDFFMSEKGKSYDAHYRSIVQPFFSKIGLSVIVVPSEQRYYLTVHYITQ